MYKSQAIYTEKNNCQDCYKCIRWCPVKSIKVEKDSASIIAEDCITCGRCTLICPVGAKKVRNDIQKVKDILNTKSRVIVSLAPSYAAEFNYSHRFQIIAALKQLGFSDVSETAIGAEFVSKACQKLLKEEQKKLYISSACPSAVSLIQIYFPELTDFITPIMSPLMAHAKFLKETYGSNTKVVFIGPCIAKKNESDNHPELIDAALTFNDLNEWFKEENIILDQIESHTELSFIPFQAAAANKYPVDGGMIHTIKQDASMVDYSFMSFSGIGTIKKVLSNINQWETTHPVFLELLTCEQGCINGPGTSSQQSIAEKRYKVIIQPENTKTININGKQPNLSMEYKSTQKLIKTYTTTELSEALQSIGKTKTADELNCGGCGYNTCRDFAKALLENKAEQNMCVSYMRKVAQDKASALLQKMPVGIVMVDENMKIIEANRNFADYLGTEIKELFELNPGLSGAHIDKLFPSHKLFFNMLQTGEESLEKDIRENDRLFHLTIFTIQKHRIVCGLFRNMFAPEVRNDEVINRTKMVIKENLSTVQKIALLLGENASKTEAILNSIVESHRNSSTIDE